MKKRFALAAAAVLTLALSATSFAATMKYAVTFPSAGTQADGAQKFADLVKEYTNGSVEVEIYYASTLGGNTESMEGLRMGTIEATELSLTAISAYSDIWSTFSLPYLWESGQQAIDVLSSEEVMSVLEEDLESNGMMAIAWQNLGSRNILNTMRPINTPEDLKGMTIRVIQDPVLVDSIEAMGGAPVTMAWSECYSGLEQGTINGLENSAPVIVANSMENVGKYYSLTEQFIMPDPILVSAMWFNTLTPEEQEGILKAGEEYTRVWNEEIWPEAEAEALKTIADAGCEVNEIDKTPFIEATQSVRDDFAANGTPEQIELYNLLLEVRG